MKPLVLLLLWCLPGRLAAESLPENLASLGQLVLTQFVNAPFPHPSRATGYTYKGEFFPAQDHYSDSTVALFVPNGFRPGSTVDFVVHFHGWRNDVPGTLRQFQLVEQFAAAGKNAILVVPEGPHNAPDSGGGKLEEPDGFKRFMAEVILAMKTRKLIPAGAEAENIILAGHSGGYQVMSTIVACGGLTPKIREVWLFDALYAQGDRFLAWAEASTGRLLNIYTDGGGTKTRTEEMIATLKQKGLAPLVATDLTVSPQALQTNRFIFLHTDLTHNDVLAKRKTFQSFLTTSCLDPISNGK